MSIGCTPGLAEPDCGEAGGWPKVWDRGLMEVKHVLLPCPFSKLGPHWILWFHIIYDLHHYYCKRLTVVTID